MKRIEHLGIAVEDLSQANELFERLFGPSYKVEEVEEEGVSTSFFKVGDNKIELLEAKNADSPIARFIEKNGEGLHHVAFEVEDIQGEMERLQNEGFRLIHEEPKEGADNKSICFLHPKDTKGLLIELCQEKP
ncbi:MAG: methylmalonyl-CoA epimerase [Flavobacteriales bacterium]